MSECEKCDKVCGEHGELKQIAAQAANAVHKIESNHLPHIYERLGELTAHAKYAKWGVVTIAAVFVVRLIGWFFGW